MTFHDLPAVFIPMPQMPRYLDWSIRDLPRSLTDLPLTSPDLRRSQLYFGHEMGWALWKWLLLLLLLAGTGAAGILINRPGAFGGEVVVDSATVVHSNITVIKDTTLH